MPNPTTRPAPAAPLPALRDGATTYLGPATVLAARGRTAMLRLADAARSEVEGTLALTFPYDAAPGDELLVLGQDGRHFVVGVLTASRPAALVFHGDVDVHAVGGRLTLHGDRAVELDAPRVTLRAQVLRTLANTVVEKADQVRRWVRGLLAIRAGSSRRTIDGHDSTRCQNSTTLAKETVTIDGDQLHLGH